MRGMNETNPSASPETPAEGACAGQPGVPPRVQRWCAQLLDLSRRNRLLNFKEGPHAVRLELKLPARLEDALAEGEAHKVLELPPNATEDFLAAEAEHHRLYVSPKYLSAICKAESGKTANQWITEYTLEDIRYQLLFTNHSIKEITHQLGFPNTSFFGKYVRQHFGTSPKALRDHSRNT